MSTTTARDARIAALLRKAADELDPKGPKAAASVKTTSRAKTLTAKERKAKAQKSAEFVAWMQDTAEARAERKATNAVLAKALRAAGINPSGAAWEAAKAAPTVAKAVKAAKKVA